MTDKTTYQATIPAHHMSEHRSESAAIRELRKAEKLTGLVGSVVMLVQSGSYQSRTVVYPQAGPTMAA